MGKRQHQKDKMYLTCSEWTEFYGGKKAERGNKAGFRRLPFYCCSLSFQPFEHPLCTPDGDVFDLMNIVPYLKKYGHHPLTGKLLSKYQPLDPKTLFKLNFHKNAEGKYHCPVTFKVFNENAHIVTIRTTGNVYSMEAVQRLNLKPCSLRDLITDETFTRADIVTLQDPMDLDKFNMTTFHHLNHSLTVDEEEKERVRKDPTYYLNVLNPETRATLEELYQHRPQPEKKCKSGSEKAKATARTSAHYSTGTMAQGFTSTTLAPVTNNEAAVLDRDTLRNAKIKKKGYIRLHTSLGDLNLELHCDLVPLACENFVKHCHAGYYNGTIFHRSIRNFMIQAGDPSGTGKGGESVWGKPFKDEFRPNLTHTGRGVVSMANSGRNTNTSQFFITFRSCKHLDNKHTVFGRVVGGLEVLNTMEKIETDDEDRPKEEIRVVKMSVFVDPFQEAEEQLRAEEEKEREQSKPEPPQVTAPTPHHSGVGKYIAALKGKGKKRGRGDGEQGTKETVKLESTKKLKLQSSFGDFGTW